VGADGRGHATRDLEHGPVGCGVFFRFGVTGHFAQLFHWSAKPMIADAVVRAGMEEIVNKVPNPQQLHQVPVVPIHFRGRQPLRSSLIAPFLLTLAAYGQGDLKPEPKNPAPGQAETQHAKPLVRRLDSITWNPVTAELSWVVSSWDSMELSGQPASRDTYSM